MASFDDTDAANRSNNSELTDKSETQKAHQKCPPSVGEVGQQIEQSIESQGKTSRSESDDALHAHHQPSSRTQEVAAPASSGVSSGQSCEVKQVSPFLGTGLGNIVDYPITPESSEEEQVEADTEDAGVKKQQQESQDIAVTEPLVGPNEEGTHSQVEKKIHEGKSIIQDETADPTAVNIPEIEDKKFDICESESGDDKPSTANMTVTEMHVESKQDIDVKQNTEQDVSNVKEKASQHLPCLPSAENDFNNSAKVPEDEPSLITQVGDEQVEEPSDKTDNEGVKADNESVKADNEAVKADNDELDTASQGSAEFQPQLDDPSKGPADLLRLPSESDSRVPDDDKCVFPETKADEESMDVDGEDSIQDVDELVGTPSAALDVDEAVGTPTAALDVEDGDSLLPDTELIKPAVSKTGGFHITAAFMDENSLSLDCVLGMSSTVPEGDVSMDLTLSSNISKDFHTPAKRSRPGSVMSGIEPDLDDDGNFPAENLFEYQWPLDGGEWYMLQEQLSEYLQIKSFKRKYPDLYRRTCDKNEKDFLRERGVVTETQCDLGLTALKSEEVYDLMHKDYGDRYREYAHVLHEKERQTINNKHKEYEVPKLDKGKMGAYIKKAVKAAADFNAQFQRERREERRAYFDMQTFMIQYPAGRYKKVSPEATKPGAYPVALIPGQFQNYYCKYTSDELKYLPLNTAVFDPPKRMANTLVKPTSDQESSEVEDSTEDKAGSASEGESDGDGSSDSDGSDSEAEEEAKPKEEVLAVPLVEEKCRICNSVDAPPPEKKVSRGKKVKQEKIATDDQEMIKCSECGTVGHPSCLDLTNAMVSVIRTYPWQCMECKTCVECMDPYDEDKMMFCDRCDRGYHTFCVGLRSIPTGRWECRSCKGTDTPRARKRTSLAK